MTVIIRIIAVGGLAATAFGCAKPFDFKGHWIGDRGLVAPAGQDPVLFHTISKVEVTIKDNGRFDLFDSGVSVSGFIDYSGDSAGLQADTIFGRALKAQASEVQDRWSKACQVKGQKDGTVLYQNPNSTSVASIVLKREPKP